MSTPSSTSKSIWRAWRCPRCQYDLSALPPDHACPECGYEPPPDTLVLLAHVPAQRRASMINLIYGVFVGALGVTYLVRGNQLQGTWRAIIAVLILGVFAYIVWRRLQMKAQREADFALAIDGTSLELWAGGKMKKRMPIHHVADAEHGRDGRPSTILTKRFFRTRFAIDYPPAEIEAVLAELRRRTPAMGKW